MNMSRRTGVLGGMFDPPHLGHLEAGAAAEQALALTALLVVPASIPPHRPQPAASSHHRFAMTAMAIAGRTGWRALDIEVRNVAPSYTADTLRRLHALGYAPRELFFITGADAFAEIATWKDYPAIFDLAHFAVVTRPGTGLDTLRARLPALRSRMRPAAAIPADSDTSALSIFLIDAPTPDVSSTAVRRALHEHRSLAGLVPAAVERHITQHGLYKEADAAETAPAALTAAKSGRVHGED
jgi:nicotinate-nucleotide adenylyltransferase